MSTILTIVLFLILVKTTGVDSWGIKSSVEFEGKQIRQNPLFRPENRYEQAERNTSEAYTLWDEIGLRWIEWPGNITKLDIDFPVLKWNGKRAKLIRNPCNVFLGMNFVAYAYKHIHLTYGSFRITSSYCPPLSIPRKVLPNSNTQSKSVFISVSDFEFVPNELLVILEDRVVVSIGPLEDSYRRENPISIPTLTYRVANGITSEVDKLVTQSCCNKHEICKTGDIVLAYKQRSTNFIVFASSDSGQNFKQLVLSSSSTIMHAVLSFPALDKLLVFHVNEGKVGISSYSLKNGQLSKSSGVTNNTFGIKGSVQVLRLGQEMSFLLWDYCRVWYSYNSGKRVIQANFYINSAIKNEVKHSISPNHCVLAEESTAFYDETGKVGLIDSANHFLYGIDTKSSTFGLVVTSMDFSLLAPGVQNSIVPNFDFNNRPKLMYPPKFLRVRHPAVQDKDYPKRLGMRLLPKTIFPTDFMQPFYEEHIPKRYKYLGIAKCNSSSLSVDSSISQKTKTYKTSPGNHLKFILEFRSTTNTSSQLKFEPAVFSKYLKFKFEILDSVKLGMSNWNYIKYRITVEPRPSAKQGSNYRLNFFTRKSIRCVHQPQVTLWIQVVDDANNPVRKNVKSTPVDSARSFQAPLTAKNIKLDKNPIKKSTCGGTRPWQSQGSKL